MVNGGSQMSSSDDVFQGNAAQGVDVAGSLLRSFQFQFLNNAVGVRVGRAPRNSTAVRSVAMCGDGMTLLGNATVAFRVRQYRQWREGCPPGRWLFRGFRRANVTGNLSGPDVDCEPQFPITRFVERTGGVTNCVAVRSQ